MDKIIGPEDPEREKNTGEQAGEQSEEQSEELAEEQAGELAEEQAGGQQCLDYSEFVEGDFAQTKKFSMVKISAVFYGIMAFLGLIWIYFQDGGLAKITGPILRGDFFLRDLSLGLVIALVVIVLSRLSVKTFRWGQEMEKSFRGLLGNLKIRDIFCLALFSGLGEEILFRGAIQNAWGLIPASLLFGCMHVMPSQNAEGATKWEAKSFVWTVFAIVMGFAMGYSYQYTGNLLTPVATHFTVNFVNLIFITHSSE